MKRTLLLSTTAALLFAALPASAQEFSGDTKYACEAILCLSTGQRPDACMPSIRRYFSIIGKKPGDTIRMRRDFLKGCPAASYDAGMVNLVDAIANGAGRCDAAALNASSIVMRGGEDGTYYVSNALPAACAALASHTYTDATANPVAVAIGSKATSTTPLFAPTTHALLMRMQQGGPKLAMAAADDPSCRFLRKARATPALFFISRARRRRCRVAGAAPRVLRFGHHSAPGVVWPAPLPSHGGF